MPVEADGQVHLKSFKRPESALVVVHTRTDVLLIKRTDHEDFWQSVTGSLEWEERPLSAATRELAEETGIINQPLRNTGITRRYQILMQWRCRYAPGTESNREHLFYCALEKPVPVTLDPAEHCDYVWLPFDQAMEMVFSWSNRLAISSLR